MRELYSGESHRNSIYYLMKRYTTKNPTERAFRDLHYKYIYYDCSDSTEMFFDEVNDPLELTNLVNNGAYQSLLETYRIKFDSAREAWNDTATYVVATCSLSNPVYQKFFDEEEIDPDQPYVSPTLVDHFVEVYTPWKETEVILLNVAGQEVKSWRLAESISQLDIEKVPAGTYFIQFQSDSRIVTRKIFIR